jgi:hypothetical protein
MKTILLLLMSLLLIFACSCRSNDKVILLEERDPIVKTLYEQDSIVIYKRDSLKNKTN